MDKGKRVICKAPPLKASPYVKAPFESKPLGLISRIDNVMCLGLEGFSKDKYVYGKQKCIFHLNNAVNLDMLTPVKITTKNILI